MTKAKADVTNPARYSITCSKEGDQEDLPPSHPRELLRLKFCDLDFNSARDHLLEPRKNNV